MREKTNKDILLRNLFRILAIIVAVVGVALGIYFGFDEVTTINLNSKLPTTQTVFELWRAFIFWFSGLNSALCLFAVSCVFGSKIKK